jgi:hypothetical protein
MSVSRNKSQRSNKKHMGNNLKKCPNKTRRTKHYKGGTSNEDKILAMADKTTKAYNLVEERKLRLETIREEMNKAPGINQAKLSKQFIAATEALEKAMKNLNKYLEKSGSEGNNNKGNNNNNNINDKTRPFKWGGRVLIGVVVIIGGITAVVAN